MLKMLFVLLHAMPSFFMIVLYPGTSSVRAFQKIKYSMAQMERVKLFFSNLFYSNSVNVGEN